MKKQKLNDDLLEVMFMHAAHDYIAQEITNLQQEVEKMDEQKFSNTFLDKMDKLILQEKLEIKKKRWLNTAKVSAILLVGVIVVHLFTSTKVEAFRLKIFNLIFNKSDNYVEINAELDENKVHIDKLPEGWSYIYIPTYLPDKYKFKDVNTSLKTITITYTNQNDEMITFIQKNYIQDKLIGDDEKSKFKKIKINKIDGYLIENDYGSEITWQNNEYTFRLIGMVDEDELLNMAEKVKIQN